MRAEFEEIAKHCESETGVMSEDGLFTEHERLNLQYALVHLPPEGRDACNKILVAMAEERKRLRALVAAQPERAASYALVSAELDAENVIGVICTAPNRWALVVESEHPDGDAIETDEYATLIEAVDALEARMKGGPNG